jgi:hypothetical protein
MTVNNLIQPTGNKAGALFNSARGPAADYAVI